MSRVEHGANTDNYNVFIADDVLIKWRIFFFFFFLPPPERNEIITSKCGRLNTAIELLLLIFLERGRDEVNFVFSES